MFLNSRRIFRWFAASVALLPLLLGMSPFVASPLPDPAAPVTDGNTPPDGVTAPDGDGGSRPRVVLVLSGGGARGSAHVGVLRVLEEARIPVDAVVGTSMGSIVGGLYAAGMTPDELEVAMVETDWHSVFTDRPPREVRYFRRKEDDADFLVRYKMHFRDGKPRFPMGFLQGQTLENLLKYYEITRTDVTNFDDLTIPFRAVATDLATGLPVVLDHGSLATAMRASMSIPGVFPPVTVDGQLLVDGGAAANLPVEVARVFDADVVIAVDISTPLDTESTPASHLQVVHRLTGFLTKGNVQRSKAELRTQDILIEPDLGEITIQDFERADEAIAIGEQAAREALDSLGVLSVDEVTWKAWIANHRRPAPAPPVVTGVELINTSAVNDRIILAHLDLELGQPLDIDRLSEELSRLYGLDYFDPIHFEVERSAAGVVVIVHTPGRNTGLTTAQFGLQLEDDFKGGDSYGLGVRLQRIAANRRGGEWRFDLRLGDRASVRLDYFQPLDPRLRWFFSPIVFFDQDDRFLVRDGARLGELLVDDYGVGLALGRNIARWGQLRFGLNRYKVSAEVIVPEGIVPSPSLDVAEWTTSLAYDTLDAPAWPRRGGRGLAIYTNRFQSLGGELDTSDAQLRGTWAMSAGRTTFVPGAEVGVGIDSTDPTRGFELGGVFRLSGLEPGELLGQEYLLGRVIVYHELSRRTLRLLKPGWYVGGSLEAGNVFDEGQSIAGDRLMAAGSVFLAADTILGPIQVGWGFAEEGRSRVYLSIGRSYF